MRRDRHGSGRRPRGHHHGYDRCRPARGNRDRHSRGHRQCLHRRVRHRGSVPGRRHAAGCLPHHRGTVRIQPDDSGERGAAARAAGDRQFQAGAVLAPGDRHRHRRCSARRHVAVAARRQCRSAAGAGITGQRPQLDAAHDADAGQPHQQRERLADAGHLRRVVSAEHGRPAGDAAHRADWLRAAAVQPRGDGGIPVHHQPVRRDAGPVERRPGERRHEVGDQRLFRIAERLLPSRQLQREGLHRRRSTARIRTSRSPARLAGRSSATGRTSLATTRGSATRSRSRSPAPTRRSISRRSSARTSSAWPGPASTSNWAAVRA